MIDLNTTIISNLESTLNSNLNSCTLYKQKFAEPISVGLNIGAFDGQYILVKGNTPKVAVFYNISYNSLRLCFIKYTSDISGIFSKVYDLPLFNSDKLSETIITVFSNIEF